MVFRSQTRQEGFIWRQYLVKEHSPISHPVFLSHAKNLRLPRSLDAAFYIPSALFLQYCWRWTGFSYGIDVIMTFVPKTKQLSLRRNTYTHPVSGAVCLHQQRHLLVKVSAAAFDVNGCTSYYKCSGLLDMTLDPDEEKVVLQLDRSVVFPLSISVHMALVSANI